MAASEMARRKGEATYRQVDRDYPFQIEIRVAEIGWMTIHDAMAAFCARLEHKKRPIGRERRAAIKGDAVRFCFKALDLAERFRARFGGEQVPPLTRDRRARSSQP
jgi:hypothetical protein